MRWAILLALMSVGLGGCGAGSPIQRSPLEQEMFGPKDMSFFSYTKLKDWTADNIFDGVEAVMEFDDQFGDPTKAAGTIRFELYEYRQSDPEPRGVRLHFWDTTIANLEEQKGRWDKVTRTYTFQLAAPEVTSSKGYVVTAMFQAAGGGRLWAQIVIPPVVVDKGGPNATQPTTRTPQP